MIEYATAEWSRAMDALRGAGHLAGVGDSDGAASRAYYAAFHAATALLALDEKSFTKHSALEAAVHRDLVNSGRWTSELGRDFSFVMNLRAVGDYGRESRVTTEQAADALAAARRILEAAHRDLPADFPELPEEHTP